MTFLPSSSSHGPRTEWVYALLNAGDTIGTDQIIIQASDANFPYNPINRCSSQGFILKLFGGLVD
jgi:hypothetical protein